MEWFGVHVNVSGVTQLQVYEALSRISIRFCSSYKSQVIKTQKGSKILLRKFSQGENNMEIIFQEFQRVSYNTEIRFLAPM